MKYLIVNADDFGASRGINQGVIAAHRQGILTSASLMVTAPWSQDAAALGNASPELSVGLHADLTLCRERKSADWLRETRGELRAQFMRFRKLTGYSPTHLDSHHNLHREPELLPLFLELACEYDLPLREHSCVRYYSNFYGQWDGQTHLEQISAENLVQILQGEIGSGVTEMSCHPGYIDPDFFSGYSIEREAELVALCDPRVRHALEEHHIELIGYQELDKTRANSDLCAAAVQDCRHPVD
jgi:predicted glycoside hydrolase/deacetylase ChbG (UPF0249 family)